MPKYILTRIDKQKQLAHQEKIGSIYISSKFLYMKYNLQYGDVVQIGKKAAAQFPALEVGDKVLFRHTIESEDWRLLYKEPSAAFPNDFFRQDEYRVIDGIANNGREVLGWIKPDGTWVANDRYIYVSTDVKRMNTPLSTSLFIDDNDNSWKDTDVLMKKLEQMQLDQENIKEKLKNIRDPYELENTYKYLERVAMDMERTTKMIHAKKVCVATIELVGPEVSRRLEVKAGTSIVVEDYQLMYPLNILGRNYLLIEEEYVFGVLN